MSTYSPHSPAAFLLGERVRELRPVGRFTPATQEPCPSYQHSRVVVLDVDADEPLAAKDQEMPRVRQPLRRIAAADEFLVLSHRRDRVERPDPPLASRRMPRPSASPIHTARCGRPTARV